MSNERAVFFCGELMTDRGRSSVVGLRRARERNRRGEIDELSWLWCTGDVGEWKQVKVSGATKECMCKTRQKRKERKKVGEGLRWQEEDKAAMRVTELGRGRERERTW